MKILKWLAVSVLLIFGVLVVIGLVLPDQDEQREKTVAKVDSKKVPTRPADQCLDSLCISAGAAELLGVAWREKPTVSNSELSDSQRNLLDTEESALLELCQTKQAAHWGSKAESVCKVLVRGASNFIPYDYRPLQVKKVLTFFAENDRSVCEFGKEPLKIVGHIQTDSGLTKAEFRFDKAGQLRVFAINKPYADQTAETNDAITAKLLAKHSYLIEAPNSRVAERIWQGQAAWGGLVKMTQLLGAAPMIELTANQDDFSSTQQSPCQQAKSISVQ